MASRVSHPMLRFVLAVLVIFFLAMPLMGIQALLPVFRHEGIYSWLCTGDGNGSQLGGSDLPVGSQLHYNDNASSGDVRLLYNPTPVLLAPPPTCDAQTVQLYLAFTIFSSAINIGCILVSFSLHYLGNRKTAWVGCVLSAIGLVLMGLESDRDRAFIPGYALLGVSTTMISLPLFSAVSYVPDSHQGAATSVVVAALDSSCMISYAIQVVYFGTTCEWVGGGQSKMMSSNAVETTLALQSS